jgi:hypothetical protein
MGFFSSLWKGIGNVFKGIMKIFDPILKPLGKLLNSSWGKALMMAVSVFTFGSALMAGGKAFMSTLATGGEGSFMQAFVNGGKEFMGTLLGTAGEQAPADAAGAAAQQSNSLMEGAVSTAADPLALNTAAGAGEAAAAGAELGAQGAGGILEGAKSGVDQIGNLVGGQTAEATGGALSKAMAGGVGPPSVGPTAAAASAPPPGGGGNWLTKAAGKAWDFVKSDTGQNLIGGALQGYTQGERDDALYRHYERYDRDWRKNADSLMQPDPETPERWNRDPHRLSQQRTRSYTPSIPFGTPARSN